MQLYSALSPEARLLVDEAIAHLQGEYDPATGLVTETFEGTPYRSVRNSMYYALGVLLRDDPGAEETAETICRAVLSLQFNAPGEIFHGTFRHPDDPVPPDGLFSFHAVSPTMRYMGDVAWENILCSFSRELAADPSLKDQAEHIEKTLNRALIRTIPVAWDTYEPNLREFIGMTFAMLLEHFEDRLSPQLLADIRQSCRMLMDGAMERVEKDLTPLNTNIRIMYIFLLDYFSRKLEMPHWREESLLQARRLLNEYREHHACAEFNSPTYCGVDLSTLGFWRRYGSTEELRTLGSELEEGIWQDMADFYNPSMRAFSGPYSRSYELDMSIHTCFYDILFLGLGAERFPYHPFSIESVINPLTVLGDIRIPASVMPRFLETQAPRMVTRQFRELSERGEPGNNHALCTAQAWITPDFMAGALSGSENPSHQLHPLVIFWRAPGGIGTICVLRSLPDGTMNHLHTVLFDGHVREQDADLLVTNKVRRDVIVFFEISCPGLAMDQLSDGCWQLPGRTFTLKTGDGEPSVTRTGEQTVRICYTLKPGASQSFELSWSST
ncbi:MAG: hypothetical protein IJL88_11105 [Clostridia bacterium]|nr:hypothetical protein [Clostridia bacterium]